MKILFISDIHGNDFALEAILNDTIINGIDRIYCLGDFSGYFTGTERVLELLKLFNVESILGNHEEKLIKYSNADSSKKYFNVLRDLKINIKDKDISWISSLPHQLKLYICDKQINLIHGGPNDLLNDYVYPDQLDNIIDILMPGSVNIFGHTHLQFSVIKDTIMIANPGSVGLPRNGDLRAHGVILNTSDWTFYHLKTNYEVDKFLFKYTKNELIHKSYFHNIAFGRSSNRPMKFVDLNFFNNIFLNQIDESKILFKYVFFGFVFSKSVDNFKNRLTYLAFYDDNTIEMTTSNLIFNWQINQSIMNDFKLDSRYLKADNSGIYYSFRFGNTHELDNEFIAILNLFLE